MSFDIGPDIRIRWRNSKSGGEGLDLEWQHPCTKYVPEDNWMFIDVTSGTHHSIAAGGPGDEEHLTLQGSLLCPMCKTHGFIEHGKWRNA